MDQTDSRRSTLLVVMIVITIGLVIGGVAVVIHQQADRPRRQNQCGKNQSQILGAMIAYQTEEELISPELLKGISSVGATKGRLVTTKFFESVAAHLTLPNSLFRCYASSSGQITIKPNPSDPSSVWGKETGRMVGYALDWAAPMDPGASRPMIADRDVKAHQDSVLIAFGDAHVTKVRVVARGAAAPGTLVTEGIDGKSVTVATQNVRGSGLPMDDIYSPADDTGDPLQPGGGEAERAWVK
jgi:hypothetical protein